MALQMNHLTAIFAVSAILAVSGCNDSSAPATADASSASQAVQPAEAAPAPAPAVAPAPAPDVNAVALKYDNQIVHQPEAGRGKDDGWFLVKDGKRRWITDDKWPALNGYDPYKVIYITPEEFSSIPEDPRPLPNPDEDVATK